MSQRQPGRRLDQAEAKDQVLVQRPQYTWQTGADDRQRGRAGAGDRESDRQLGPKRLQFVCCLLACVLACLLA